MISTPKFKKIINAFLGLLMHLELRQASTLDVLTVFGWANDHVTRQSSFSVEPILFESHTKWFHQKVQDKNCIYLLLWVDNKPAGQIRFDKTEENYVISFGLDHKFRGKGLGVKILE